jgi:pyruvate dehydrogenase E2 component (dihydrolipoamide acetyltransferase)
MSRSAHSTAPVTLTTEVDATELVALRERLKAQSPARAPTYTDLIIKLTQVALERHPTLNAYWNNDQLWVLDDIHIGLAVDTEEGLLVPVVRDVQKLDLDAVAEESRALAEKARSRQLSPDELQGGTFTITNLGAYGIDAFTPIINTPECAILGVGRIVRKPAVHEDRIVPRDQMALSLTFDHRAVDGGPAARFLGTVRELIEERRTGVKLFE